MEPTIEEGRLTEAPTDDASGVVRIAHGEFESARGELASYAFGWQTDDPDSGRITIGIGAGNEGGVTIHARVFADGDRFSFGLVDEPFETVPQGGPHVTAEEARAHGDLRFMWHVAEAALNLDGRGWWMWHTLAGTGALYTPEVYRRDEPVLLVVHEDVEEPPRWQLIGATDAGDAEDAVHAHLFHAVEEDPSLVEVLDLARGERAERDHPGAPWRRSED